jgi:hypothetical protein
MILSDIIKANLQLMHATEYTIFYRGCMRSFFLRFSIIGILITSITFLSSYSLNFDKLTFGIDDSDIFLVYAKNLAQGHGFVYNIAGEHVEGFTSLLWVLIAAVLYLCTQSPEFLLLLFNIVLLTLVITKATDFVFLEFCALKNANITKLLMCICFVFTVISSPRYITWVTISIMDTGLWSALLVITTLIIIRKTDRSSVVPFSVAVSLLVLTRPEALLWGIVFIFVNTFKEIVLFDTKKAILRSVSSAGVFITSSGLLTVFRLVYFGYPLPNTYYAKVSSSLSYNVSEGFKYLNDFLFFSTPTVTLSFICIILYTFLICLDFRGTAQKNRECFLKTNVNGIAITIISAAGLFIPVLSGGDHFGSHRFFQPVYPILIINMFIFIKYILQKDLLSKRVHSLTYKTTFLYVILFTFMSMNWFQWRNFATISGLRGEFTLSQDSRKYGKFLSHFYQSFQNKPLIGVIAAGGIKLMYDGPVFDLMGLNNTAMGHSKGIRKGLKNHAAFEKDVFYEIQPDILPLFPFQMINKSDSIINHNKMSSIKNMSHYFLKDLFDEPTFRNTYAYVRICSNNLDQCLEGFCSHAYIEKIAHSNGYSYKIVPLIQNYIR